MQPICYDDVTIKDNFLKFEIFDERKGFFT